MLNRYLIAPAIIVLGLLGFFSAQSYANGAETRANADYLSFDRSVSVFEIKPYMRAKGYWIVEETTYVSCGSTKWLCGDYGSASLTFESLSNEREKFKINYSGKLTPKGCQLQVTNISKEIDNAKN